MDITVAVSERAEAQKRLAENPFDVSAMCMLSRAQEQVEYFQTNILQCHQTLAEFMMFREIIFLLLCIL